MSFLTRQQLIKAKRWPTATVQTEEHGEIRLARLSADGSMRVQAAREAAGVGLEKERQASAALLEEACIDDDGAPLFAAAGAALAFLGTISGPTLTQMVIKAGELNAPKKSVGDAGNSEAGPG